MIVVDTNVVVHLWLPGDQTPDAERLVERDPEWAAPILWRSEFRNVLAGWIRRGHLELLHAERIASDAERLLAGREFQVPSGAVLRRAAASRLTAHDCEFVVLAERLGVTLVTRDQEVLKAFPAVARHPEAFLASGRAGSATEEPRGRRPLRRGEAPGPLAEALAGTGAVCRPAARRLSSTGWSRPGERVGPRGPPRKVRAPQGRVPVNGRSG